MLRTPSHATCMRVRMRRLKATARDCRGCLLLFAAPLPGASTAINTRPLTKKSIGTRRSSCRQIFLSNFSTYQSLVAPDRRSSLPGVLAMFAISPFGPMIGAIATVVAFLSFPGLILSAIGLLGQPRRVAGWGVVLRHLIRISHLAISLES